MFSIRSVLINYSYKSLLVLLAAVTCSSQVFSHETGAVHRHASDNQIERLKLQHHLDYHVPFNQATFIGTHNSYNTTEDNYDELPEIPATIVEELFWAALGIPGGSLSFLPTNHDHNMRTQLENGVRLLNIDIAGSDGDVKMCHAFCLGGAHELSLKEGLNRINSWLTTSGNGDEVILIILEDNLKESGLYTTAFEEIEQSNLYGKVYTRSDHDLGLMGCQQLPMGLTKKQVRMAGKNVVIASFNVRDKLCNQSNSDWRGVVWNAALHPIPGDSNGPDFDTSIKNTIKRYPHVHSVAAEDAVSLFVTHLPYSANDISTALKQGAGLFGLDFYVNQPSERYEALIWSWDSGQPATNECAVHSSTNRWKTANCSELKYHACQNSAGSWVISTTQMNWAGGGSACGSNTFSAPVNANLNEGLRLVKASEGLSGDDVWINHRHNGTEWVTNADDFELPRDPLLVNDTGNISYNSFQGLAQLELLKIPENTDWTEISFTVKGGDGGSARVEYKSCFGYTADTRTRGGGGGAIVTAKFSIGYGDGAIPPGSSIGFLPGEAGKGRRLTNVSSCEITGPVAIGGGGGGSGVWLFEPNGDSRILVVAGGGGGSRINAGTGNQDQGRKGSTDLTNTTNTSPGCGGNDCGTLLNSSGGGSITQVGQGTFCGSAILAGFQSAGGGIGLHLGAAGGQRTCGADTPGENRNGGFGFGSGGPSGGGIVSGGGGGGGFKGGNGGANSDGGYGGGSYVDPGRVSASAVGGDHNYPSTNGYISYAMANTNTFPLAQCEDTTVTASAIDCTASVSFGATDNEGDATCTQDPPPPYSVGVREVAFDCSDGQGGSTCWADVTVLDVTAPTAQSLVVNLAQECNSPTGAILDVEAIAWQDACDASLDIVNDAPSILPFGQTVVTWQATDDSGNVGTAVQTVTVADTTGPAVIAPDDLTVECTSPTSTPVALGTPSVTDTCDANPTLVNNAPQNFSLGATPVTWTATDNYSNVGTAVQSVTVVDTTAPAISCPTDIVSDCNNIGQATITPGVASGSDICGGVSLTSHNTAVFGIGTHTLTYIATDPQGLQSSCTSNITVHCVNDAPNIVSVTNATQSLQYSDRITPIEIIANDPDSDTLTLTQSGVPDGLSISESSCEPYNEDQGVTCQWTLSGQVLSSESTYPITLTVSDQGAFGDNTPKNDSDSSVSIEVVAEAVDVSFDENNLSSLEVTTSGGYSGLFSLNLSLSEEDPDTSTGTADFADLSNAEIQMELIPIADGYSVFGSCSKGAVVGTGATATLPVSCTLNNVPVNVYTVSVTVDGGYYLGSGESGITVYDASLGEETEGGAKFKWPGTDNKTKINFEVEFEDDDDGFIEGKLRLTRKIAKKMKFKLKSNSVDTLVINPATGNETYGWASFTGTGTLKDPDKNVTYVSYIVYVEDRGNHGDKVWVEVRDIYGVIIPEMSLPEPAEANAVVIDKGEIEIDDD